MCLDGAASRVKRIPLRLRVCSRTALVEAPVVQHFRDVGDPVRLLRAPEDEIIILCAFIGWVRQPGLLHEFPSYTDDMAEIIDRAQEIRVIVRLHIRLHILSADPDLVFIRINEIRSPIRHGRHGDLKKGIRSNEVIVVGKKDPVSPGLRDGCICILCNPELPVMVQNPDPAVPGGKRIQKIRNRRVRPASVRQDQFIAVVALRSDRRRKLPEVVLRSPVTGHHDADEGPFRHRGTPLPLLLQRALGGQVLFNPF